MKLETAKNKTCSNLKYNYFVMYNKREPFKNILHKQYIFVILKY